MNYYEFSRRNLMAVEASRHICLPSQDIGECNRQLGYRGFVNCIPVQGEDSFVMFTNADDVVAGSYMYAGPASFETGTLRLWTHLARRSSWIHDIGAFTGVFALAAVAANPHCRVMAFEPSFVTYSRLLVNIQANGFDGHIAPIRVGLGAGPAEMELRHTSGVYVMSSDETFVEDKVPKPWYTEKVQVMSLDHLLARQDCYRREIIISTQFGGADLVKIDVEGFESEVLKGMVETIARDRPVTIVEILDNNNEFLDLRSLNCRIAEILTLLGAGYQVRHIDEGSGNFTDAIQGRNHLFIHDDRLHMLEGYC